MKIIVDDKETETVGTTTGNEIAHKNDIIRHANRLRDAGAKKMLFELTAEEAAEVGDLPRGRDFRVAIDGEDKPAPAAPATKPAA